MNNKTYWTLNSVLSFAVLAGLHAVNQENKARRPASNAQALTLEIKNIQLGADSKLQQLRDVSLRATINREHVIDLLPGQKLNLTAGHMAEVNLKLPIRPNWIQNDQLEIKLEFVKSGFLDNVVVRCAHVAKKLSEYNRSYQCFVPGDTLALLTYRLGNDQAGVPTLAQHQ